MTAIGGGRHQTTPSRHASASGATADLSVDRSRPTPSAATVRPTARAGGACQSRQYRPGDGRWPRVLMQGGRYIHGDETAMTSAGDCGDPQDLGSARSPGGLQWLTVHRCTRFRGWAKRPRAASLMSGDNDALRFDPARRPGDRPPPRSSMP